MKRIIIAILTGIILLSFSSCAAPEMDYSYTIKDALKISAYLFDENSGEDYFVYNDVAKKYEYNVNESIYNLEQLKLNEVRLMCPFNYFGINLNIRFEFDGIIEVISEDKDVQMFINPDNCLEPVAGTHAGNSNPHGFEMKLTYEGYVAVNPLGSNLGHLWMAGGVTFLPNSLGREYYLTVNAYKFDDEQSPIIKARLKLVQLEDKTIKEVENPGSECFSIELISYEYSDMYKIMDDITDE